MLPIDKKRFRIPLHILFWASYLFVFSVMSSLNFPDLPLEKVMFRTAIFSLPIDITATYFTIYFLMPKFLYVRRYPEFILSFVFSAAFFILLTQISMYYLIHQSIILKQHISSHSGNSHTIILQLQHIQQLYWQRLLNWPKDGLLQKTGNQNLKCIALKASFRC